MVLDRVFDCFQYRSGLFLVCRSGFDDHEGWGTRYGSLSD